MKNHNWDWTPNIIAQWDAQMFNNDSNDLILDFKINIDNHFKINYNSASVNFTLLLENLTFDLT